MALFGSLSSFFYPIARVHSARQVYKCALLFSSMTLFANLEAAIDRNDYVLFDTNTNHPGHNSLNTFWKSHFLGEVEKASLDKEHNYLTQMLKYYAHPKTVFIPEVVNEVRCFEKHLRHKKQWFGNKQHYVRAPDALKSLKRYVALISYTVALTKMPNVPLLKMYVEKYCC